jgi:predicted PurR-regulated permease PerM
MAIKKTHPIITSIFLCAILFALLSVYGSLSFGPREFARQLGSAIGASAGVLPNEYNTLAQALLQKETEVKQKEDALAAREAEIMRQGSEKNTTLVFAVLSVGILLLFLILFNFYLDWKRKT